jgi:hypothetical protein
MRRWLAIGWALSMLGGSSAWALSVRCADGFVLPNTPNACARHGGAIGTVESTPPLAPGELPAAPESLPPLPGVPVARCRDGSYAYQAPSRECQLHGGVADRVSF